MVVPAFEKKPDEEEDEGDGKKMTTKTTAIHKAWTQPFRVC